MSTYNVNNWYWIVAGDQTKVFSSAVGAYVLPSDATYLSWRTDPENSPTAIDTEASLGEVLAPALSRPLASGVLDGYKTEQANTILGNTAFKILFNHENRLRVLEGKVPVTAVQALTAVKALM